MTITPYELRFSIFQEARCILEARASKTGKSPIIEEIIQEAEKINNFISYTAVK